MTQISMRAYDREYLSGGDATTRGLSVTYRLTGYVACVPGTSGREILHEPAAGWGIGGERGVETPPASEEAHTAAALELALQTIANRWKPSIVLHLAEGPQRRRDLEQRLPRYVSAKVLTEQLRALETDGLVYRVDRTPAGHGRHVTYALTELGRTLGPAVASLAAWAVEHGADLPRNRRNPVSDGKHER